MRTFTVPVCDEVEVARGGRGHIAKQHRFEQAEDRGVGADAESQEEERGGPESGPFHERAAGIARVAHRVFDEPCAAGVAALFTDLLQAAELDGSSASRFGFAHPVAHVVGNLALQVIAQFHVELTLEPRTAHQSAATSS